MIDAVSRLHHGRAVAHRLADLGGTPGLPGHVKERIDRELVLFDASSGRSPPFEALFHATNVAVSHDWYAPREAAPEGEDAE